MNQKKLGVGYIVPSFDDTTGWGRWVNDFLRHLVKRDIQPVVWAPRSSKKHFRDIGHKIQVHFTLPELFDYLQSLNGISSLKQIVYFILQGFQDANLSLIHSLDAYPWGIYGYYLSSKLGIPHLITTHGRYGYIPYNRLCDRFIYERILKSVGRVIPVSNAVRKAIVRNFTHIVSEDKITPLLNPVESKGVRFNRKVLRKNCNRPVIISVTRFIACKGIETSVRAFRIINQRFPDASYLIIGPGNARTNSYYQSIQRIIHEERISGVKILGRIPRSELEDLYANADVLVHTPRTVPDDFEAYGLIFLEAGLFEVPVVATHSGGVPEVIKDGENGFLVKEGDFKGVAEAVIKILSDRNMAQELVNRNKALALKRNWDWYVAEQMKIYDEVMEG